MKAIKMIAGILCCIVLMTGCGNPAQGATKTAETPAAPPTSEAEAPADAQSGVIGAEPTEAVIGAEPAEAVIGMPNPASVHCEEHGGTLDMRDAEEGQYGVCVFPDGSECDEWAFFRGECDPGDNANPTEAVIGAEPAEAVIGMPNPASVYCEEHGGTLDMRDSEEGQYGVCVFPDGGECEEWAFFRGECSSGAEAAEPADTEPVEDWVGVVVSNPEGAQFDDYFQMLDQDGTRVGITGSDAIGEQLVALRDTGTTIHVWGVIRRDVPDAYGAQIEVTRLEIE